MEIATRCVCCNSERLMKSPAVLMPFVAERALGWVPHEIDPSLKTLKPGMAYTTCNSLYCLDCFHLFCDIRFSNDEMESLYNDYRGEEYTTLREKYEPGYKHRNDHLKEGYNYLGKVEEFISPHLKEKPKILDWGGGIGKNTPFKKTAKSIEIFDISQKLGTPKRNDYDLVVCANVLEHVPYPITTLRFITWYMAKDSLLYIELPKETLVKENIYLEGIYRKKKHWHEHINFFNEKSIGHMLDTVGFKIVAFKDLSITGESTDEVFQILVKYPYATE